MKKYLLFLLLLCNVSYAQVVGSQPDPYTTYTQSQNLLSPSVNAWVGTVAGQNGGFVGGTTPAFNAGTNTIIFGYTVASATQTIGINAALASAGTGLKIGGYSYSWSINNDSSTGQYGTLSSTVSLKNTSGSILQSYTSNYPQMMGMGFITYSGTQWFPQDYPLTSVSDLELKFTGKDAKFWAGYYGPQVRMPSIKLEYAQDLCASNPLSSSSCPGYAAAYQTQQCSINPLFDPSCPGYTLAQCNLNPLSSQICSGYQAAYLAQQCSLNPLYSQDCPGYSNAYARQNILNSISNSSSGSSSNTTVVSKTEPSTSVKSDGTVQTSVSKTGDSTVDSVIENKTTSASPSETTAAVKLTPSGTQNVSSQTIASPQQTTEKSETKTTSSQSQQSSQRTTARNERTESKSGANEGKSNSEVKQASEKKAREEMKKAEQSTSFEGQIAVQANVINAMSFVPGFSSYAQSNIPDILEKQIKKQYGKDVIDNRQAGRRLFGAADRLHQEMVDGQYK